MKCVITHALLVQWVINICYSVLDAPFAEWTRRMCNERNEGLADRQDLNIAIDPDIMRAFQQSTAISTHKGSSTGLLKIGSKRRRTKAEVMQLKEEKEHREEAQARAAQRIQELEAKLKVQEEDHYQEHMAAGVLGRMMEEGVVKVENDGTYQLSKSKLDM